MSDMKQNLLFLCAAAFVLAACTQDERSGGALPEGEYPLIINATGLQAVATPASTRATVDGNWDGVTSVALSVGGTVKEYSVTTTDTEKKTATLSRNSDPFWWTSRNPITVSAWWPYATTMPDVVVKSDQRTQADFVASDFISAENQTVQFDNPTLEFSHSTARITVNLEKGNGITSVTGADVYVTGLSTDGGNPASISTYASGNDTYEALAAPQTVKANTPFIAVDLNGSTFYFRPQSDVVLTANSRYTYTVRVTAKGLELVGCTIGGWTDGGGESGTAEDLGFTYNANTHTCSVTGKIDAFGTVGGIANANQGSITACWFAGTLKENESGGIVNYNLSIGSITACYWRANTDKGVYNNEGGTIDATKVNDGESWQTAVDGMNAALTDNAYQWISGTNGLPELKKK